MLCCCIQFQRRIMAKKENKKPNIKRQSEKELAKTLSFIPKKKSVHGGNKKGFKVMNPDVKQGAPSKYTKELADAICKLTANSNMSLISVCQVLSTKQSSIDRSTVTRWLDKYEDFCTEYARAKESQADFLAEEMIKVAEDAQEIIITRKIPNFKAGPYMQAVRLKIDTMKFIAAKLKPKKYGDKVDVTSGGKELKGMTVVVGSQKEKTDLEDAG